MRKIVLGIFILFLFNKAYSCDSLQIHRLINLGNQLLFVGQTDSASTILQSAYLKSKQCNSKKLDAESSYAFAQYYINFGNLPHAVDLLKESASLSLHSSDTINFLRAYIQLSKCFRLQGLLDSSVAYIEFPLNQISSFGSYKDSAELYIELSLIQYKIIGFDDAIESAYKSLTIAENFNDTALKAKSLFALFDIYINKMDVKETIRVLPSLKLIQKYLSAKENVRFLELCAGYYAQFENDSFSYAKPLLLQAISLAQKSNFNDDLSHLYSALGNNFRNPYSDSALYYLAIGNRLAYETNNYRNQIHNLERFSSVLRNLKYYKAAFDSASKLFLMCKSTKDFLTANAIAIDIAGYYRRINDDSLFYNWMDTSRIYFLKQYDSKKANSEGLYKAILKSKEQEKNLAVKDRKIAEKEIESLRLNNYLIITVIVIILLPLTIFLALKNRHQKALLSQKKEIRENISADLHDIVGTDISAISRKSDPENSSAHGTDFIKLISDIHEKSKKIYSELKSVIWALNPENDDLNSLLAKLQETAIEQFDATAINLEIKFPENLKDKPLSPGVNRNIFLIFKEAINNILNHSKATFVEIKFFLKTDSEFNLFISDNGIGFNPDFVRENSYGLKNMQGRAKKLNGAIQIKSNPLNGCQITLEGKLK